MYVQILPTTVDSICDIFLFFVRLVLSLWPTGALFDYQEGLFVPICPISPAICRLRFSFCIIFTHISFTHSHINTISSIHFTNRQNYFTNYMATNTITRGKITNYNSNSPSMSLNLSYFTHKPLYLSVKGPLCHQIYHILPKDSTNLATNGP